jgi:outer membrane receptor protein involved in Fe transport
MSVFLARFLSPVPNACRLSRWMLAALVAVAPVLPLSLAVAAEKDDEIPEPVLQEKVTVTASRLADGGEERVNVPANVSVIDGAEIERSGARTLQELLGPQTGTILYDQTGNFVQTTFDLRGFTTGSGTKVYLDGAPLNDPVNNSLALHLVPLSMLERVEITRGSSATLAGGGSEAGVIHLESRRVEEFGGSLSLAGGSDSAIRYGGDLRHRSGRWDFVLHGSSGEDDGFRQNAGGTLTRLGGSAGLDLGGERRLEFMLVSSRADFGNPGALTSEELEEDREAAPNNRLDFLDQRYGQATLNYRGPLGGSFFLAANAYLVDRESNSLVTGRAAPVFGGSYAETDSRTAGTIVQASHRWQGRRATSNLTVGLEWLESGTDASAIRTPADDPGAVDPAGLFAGNTTDRRTQALFAQETWSPVSAWSITAGLRYDRDRLEYAESVPDPSNQDALSFSELSARAGATWSLSERYALRASYGESFLPPTVEELFAFPTFGSNPNLVPEDSRTWELGFNADWRNRTGLDVALFLVDTKNEIVFDPDSDLGLFGANVNAGETRRKGIEASLHGALHRRLSGFLNATFIDAEFANGPSSGNTVPLVPGERFAAGLDLDCGAGFLLRADATYVAEQVLDNDASNTEPRLPAYTVANVRLSWDLGRRARSGGGAASGLLFFAQVTNLLDEVYATRGIHAFDFSTGADANFFTPAPGRRFLGGVEWRF